MFGIAFHFITKDGKVYPHMGMKVTVRPGKCDWQKHYPFDIFHPHVWQFDMYFGLNLHWFCRLSSKIDGSSGAWILYVMANQLMVHKKCESKSLKPVLKYKIGSPTYYFKHHKESNESYWQDWMKK